ncbi:MAG: HlyD family efflux transporter periplasmic adaptor subunit [Deltaproteobacteria bacterium]|nr:HlyD family efflux transporter periplasmic adaptor subunit [Deltaproteobacteria bacterium]
MVTPPEIDRVVKLQLASHKIVSELITISGSQIEPREFLSRFLTSAVRLVGGAGGTVWVNRQDKLEPVFNTGKSMEVLPVDDEGEGEGGEQGVIDSILTDTKPYVFPMKSTDGESSDGLIGIYIPIEVEEGLFGVIKVVKESISNVVYEEEIELLTTLSGLVRSYLRQLNLPKVLDRMGEIQKLFQVNQEIFASIERDKIAYTLANLVPSVVRCERCIVGLAERKKIKIKAITGQDFIEKKSATVRNLREIFEHVAREGEPMTITPDLAESEVEDELNDMVASYFDVQPFRIMQAVPIKDENRSLGVISIETSKEEVFPPNDLAMFNFVCNQAATALKNARLYEDIPFARTWHALAGLKEKVAAWPRVKAITAAAIVIFAIAAVFLWKIDNKIGGDCEVLPMVKYYARTRIDGIIKEFKVKEGDYIDPGEIVALLDDRDIRKRLREAEARRSVTRANMQKFFGMGQVADYAIEELKMQSMEKEIELLLSQLNDTMITVGGSGIVLTPGLRFAERIGKPVSRGEELIEVGQLDELLLEVAVPEKDIKFIKRGQKIRFLLNAMPEEHFEVTVDSIRQKAEARPEGNFFVVVSKVDLPSVSFRVGMKGKAKIYADKAPIWKVYLRDMINFFRIKVFF